MPRHCLGLVALLLAGAAQAGEPLDGYVRQALAANAALDAEQQAVRMADARVLEAQSRLWPELGLDARFTQVEGGRSFEVPVGRLLNPVYQQLDRQLAAQGQAPAFGRVEDQRYPLQRPREQDTRLSLAAPLYAPQLHRQLEQQQALAVAARQTREGRARLLVRELKRAYHAAVQAQASLDVLGASQVLLAENVRVAQVLLDQGKVTREHGLRAEAERLALLQQLDAASAQRDAAQRQLNWLRGADEQAPVQLAGVEDTDAGGPEAAPLPAPELRQIDAALAAAAAAERAAQASTRPTLSLAADYGLQGARYELAADADLARVSLLLRWPLLDAGGRRAQQARAQALHQQLRDQRADVEAQWRLQRRAALDQLAVAQRTVDSGAARLALATESLRIAERKRAEAALTQVEFLDAERAQREARLGLLAARIALLEQRAQLEWLDASYPLPDDLMGPLP